MTRDTQVFDSGDAPFHQWKKEHPRGYVVNTRRRKTSKVTVLHRSDCGHIGEPKEGQGPLDYTRGDNIKVCSEDAEELLDWCLRERPHSAGFSGYCKTCKPEPVEQRPIGYPDELLEKDKYPEGAVTRITVNAYERSAEARSECLRHYGFKCAVCEIEFDKKYGEIGRGFIHVHHTIPLSTLGTHYRVDPIHDLIPVCPNCHSMLHRKEPPYSVDELKGLILS